MGCSSETWRTDGRDRAFLEQLPPATGQGPKHIHSGRKIRAGPASGCQPSAASRCGPRIQRTGEPSNRLALPPALSCRFRMTVGVLIVSWGPLSVLRVPFLDAFGTPKETKYVGRHLQKDKPRCRQRKDPQLWHSAGQRWAVKPWYVAAAGSWHFCLSKKKTHRTTTPCPFPEVKISPPSGGFHEPGPRASSPVGSAPPHLECTGLTGTRKK